MGRNAKRRERERARVTLSAMVADHNRAVREAADAAARRVGRTRTDREVADAIASGATPASVAARFGSDALERARDRARRNAAVRSGRLVTGADSLPASLPDDGTVSAPEWYRTLTYADCKVGDSDGYAIGCASPNGGRGYTVKVADHDAGTLRMVNPSQAGLPAFERAYREGCARVGVEPVDGARPLVAAVIGRDRTFDAARNRASESQVWTQVPAGIFDSHNPASPGLARARARAERAWSRDAGPLGVGTPKRFRTVDYKRKENCKG